MTPTRSTKKHSTASAVATTPTRSIKKNSTVAAVAAQLPVCIGKKAKSSQNGRQSHTAQPEQLIKGSAHSAVRGTPKATVATPKAQKTASIKLLQELNVTAQACTPKSSRKVEVPSGKKTSQNAVGIQAGSKPTKLTPRTKAVCTPINKKSASKGPYANTRSKAKLRS